MSRLHREREERVERKLESAGIMSGVFDCDCDCAAPPNTKEMADATVEAAKISADLGKQQIDESKRQYDLNRAVSEPVVKAQLGLMQQQQQQGDDYYNYGKDTFRPIETQMAEKALAEGSDARLEEAAGTAAADARRGQTQSANMMMRQGLRMGFSPSKLSKMTADMAGGNASAVAGAATTARNRQRDVGWARGLDAAGLGRNLPGVSQGAYGLAVNSGNSAVNNQIQPGNQLLNGMGAGAGTTMQGQGMRLNGLSSVLNAETSYANSMNQAMMAGSSGLGELGSLMGGAASLYKASDPRLKDNIKLVGVDPKTGVNIYEFTYKGDDTVYRGVMADEVEVIMPDAVEYNENGFASVFYDKLGIEMVEVN